MKPKSALRQAAGEALFANNHRRLALTAFALLLAWGPTNAIDLISLNIAKLEQSGVSAKDIELRLQIADQSQSPVFIRIARVDLGDELGRLDDVQIDCARPVIKEPVFSCADARVRARSNRFGAQDLQARLSWNTLDQTLKFSIAGLRLAQGSLEVEGSWGKRGWNLNLSARAVGLAEARKLLGTLVPMGKDWTLEGRLEDLRATLSGTSTLRRVELQATVGAVGFSNAEGTVAADQLGASLNLQAGRIKDAWQFDASLKSARGEALSGRWYWNFSNQPLVARWQGQWRDAGVLAMDEGQLSLGDFLKAGARGEFSLAEAPLIRSMDVRIEDLNLAALPPQTRDGVFSGSLVSQLQGVGHFSGRIEVQDDVPAAVDLKLDAVHLEDPHARLALAGLNGRLIWQSLERRTLASTPTSRDTQSELRWDSGLLYGVQIGPSQIQFTTSSNDVRLTAATRIPILDGGLAIAVLQLRRIGEAAMSIRFNATLDPISVAQLCEAFGWPKFAGKLSGRIPDLSLDEGVLTLGGALQASVFNGELTVKDLQLSDAFGARPRLQAGVTFAGLDLAAVTGAFSFGKITGRIDGRIADLELVGWQPVAFDADIYSTPGDRSRRRISQRAVENISSIGGGVGAAAALQRSMLRFFKEFGYDKLGISCRLANDVCLMHGVEAHDSGYYLVKGSGLPRIDVIGSQRRVDWPRLVTTLKELPESQPSVGKSP